GPRILRLALLDSRVCSQNNSSSSPTRIEAEGKPATWARDGVRLAISAAPRLVISFQIRPGAPDAAWHLFRGSIPILEMGNMKSSYNGQAVPSDGTPIEYSGGELQVPNNPIIPFIEGDGTGRDIWKASRRVFDAAVQHAYCGKRQIAWYEVFAGEKA